MVATRVLITGATGFVGQHLTRHIQAHFGADIDIVLTSKSAEVCELGTVEALDVTDELAVAAAVSRIHPTHLVHLSAISAPAAASADPRVAWEVNTLGTRAVAEAIVRHAPDCRLVFASTGLIYGASATLGQPFTEGALLAPESEYAATKAAADLLVGGMARRGLKSVRLRLFNHTGPGQPEFFFVPAVAAQIARIEAGMQDPNLKVGRVDGLRDFLDVRDVTAAYVAAIERSAELPASPIINIASGTGYRISDVLAELISLSEAKIDIVAASAAELAQQGPDNLVGDAEAAAQLLGWTPFHGLRDTLESVLSYWRQQVSLQAVDSRRHVPGLSR